MLPKSPAEYKTSTPIPECYLELVENVGEIDLYNLGFSLDPELQKEWLRLISKLASSNFASMIYRALPILKYSGFFEDEIANIATCNRQSLPMFWFRQVADSKFASSLEQISKMNEMAFRDGIFEAVLYQEFFEMQILAKPQSIEMLKSGARKWEVLQAGEFNYMLGYKYFLKLLFSERFGINDTIEVDLNKVANYDDMVKNGDGAFLPCELLTNNKNFGGKRFEIEYTKM